MANSIPVVFKYGTAEKFNTISDKDPGTIYFITDEVTKSHKIYLGDTCYSVTVVNDLNTTKTNEAPSTQLLSSELNKKTDKCQIDSALTDTELNQTIHLENNYEYRATSTSGCTGITISIDDVLSELYYSSITISNINSTGILKDFITIAGDSTISEVIYLNGDISLSGCSVVEVLFFSNGTNICCIGAVY